VASKPKAAEVPTSGKPLAVVELLANSSASMNEIEKIKEAEYFFSRMLDCEQDPSVFGYNLSAFMTAARSVLQFAYEEAQPQPNGQDWYEAWYDLKVTGNEVVVFFRDRRDFNVHRAPLQLRKDAEVKIEDGFQLRASVGTVEDGFQLRASVGTVMVHAGAETPQEAPATLTHEDQAEAPRSPKVSSTETYRFAEWAGPEDIKTLCRQYLSKLKEIIVDGQKKGFLT
jgi:hypothetical protein